jgi:hypothetical protein
MSADAEKVSTRTPTCGRMPHGKTRLAREDRRELQKIREELLTLAERVRELISRTASQE